MTKVKSPQTKGSVAGINTAVIREFIGKLNEKAQLSPIPGKLVLASFGEDPKTAKSLSPIIIHYQPGEVDKMVSDIADLSNTHNRNTYIPPVLFRSDLPDGKKGAVNDIVSVLGVVADFDDEQASEYSQRLPIEPSYVIETSKGRFQAGYYFDKPIDPETAKTIASRLCNDSACDHGTKDISHVWRVPGTLNYPNKKKVDSGRPTTPQPVELVHDNFDALISPDSIIESLSAIVAVNDTDTRGTAGADIQKYPPDISSLHVKGTTKDLILNGAPRGERSNRGFAVICALVGSACLESKIIRIFDSYPIGEKYRAKGNGRLNWLQGEISRAREYIKQQGFQYIPGSSWHHPAALHVIVTKAPENIITTHGNTFLYNEKLGIWEKADDEEIKRLTLDAAHKARCSITQNGVNSTFRLLQTRTYRKGHQWDTNTDQICCENGELRLKEKDENTYEAEWDLLPHRREHYRRSQIQVAYDDNCGEPIAFERFLTGCFLYDDEVELKIEMIYEMIGYCFLMSARFEKFWILIGPGANGKSVLLNVIRALLGAINVSAVQPDQLMNKFQRAHLERMLANIITEIEEGHRIADAQIKAITSGEPITVEHKFKEPHEITPYCTMLFASNHMPHTRDFSPALTRRAIVIPFNRIFTEKEQDKDLLSKILPELPAIMSKALVAIGNVIQNGGRFSMCAEAKNAVADWAKGCDQLALFLDECCDNTTDDFIATSSLYTSYVTWAEDSGIRHTFSKHKFSSRLQDKGFLRGQKGKTRSRGFYGIKIKTGM